MVHNLRAFAYFQHFCRRVCLLSPLVLATLDNAWAQPTLRVGANTQLVGTGAIRLVYGGGSLTNNGLLILPAGQLSVVGPTAYACAGSATVATALFNHSGSSSLSGLLSVTSQATLASGTSLNANGQLYLRTDGFASANMVNNGILTGTVGGLVTNATAKTGEPGYTTTLSTNVSGASMRYQWQISPDNQAYSDIPGATGPTYPATVNSHAYYRARLTTTNSAYDQTTPSVELTTTGMATPTRLTVLYRDQDYGNTGNNIIKPYLELLNGGSSAIPYSELSVRYWFTAEGNAPPTNLAVYYAPLGAVNMQYVALSKPRQGAYGYVEYRFPGGGSLAAGANSGPIENGIQKTDGSDFDETDDYSYQANYQDYLPNAHVTAYRTGADGVPVIVWGQEPSTVASQTAVAVYSQAKDGPTTSQIQTRLELRNTGNVALAVGRLKLRYYFTSDNGQPASVYVDYADLGAANVTARVVQVPPVNGVDSYVELSFPGNPGQLNPLSSLGAIDFRLVRSDYGLLEQTNDYSYAPNYGNVGLNAHVTAYLDDRLVFGSPPAGVAARMAVLETGPELRARLLGNPVVGEQALVEVSGVSGQPVELWLVDGQGRPLHHQRVASAGDAQSILVPLGAQAGPFLLRVQAAGQQQVLKVVRR